MMSAHERRDREGVGVSTPAAADGVPAAPAHHAHFYEGRWAEPDLSAGSLRNWAVKKQRFFLRRLRGQSGRVLDLGCGGGWKLFTKVGPVVGVDISRESLRGAAHLYAAVAVADLECLPFADASFDFVVSSDVLGHVPPDKKSSVLREIVRVLKPGGRTLHYIEAESQDPLMAFARRYPDLYQEHIVGTEGHEGMEPPQRMFQRFREVGLRPIREEAAYRLFMYVERMPLLFDNPYKKRSRTLTAFVFLAGLAARWTLLAAVANLLVALALEVGDRLLPQSWANGVLVEYGNSEAPWS